MNKPISFTIAKLLKKKNVKIDTDEVIFYKDEVNNIEEHQIKNRDVLYNCTGFGDFIPDENEYQAYAISEVVMWMYDNYKIWISVEPLKKTDNTTVYIYKIFIQGILDTISRGYTGFNSPTEAYEAAIQYIHNHKR